MKNKFKVLFLCTGNSCRSQMAEGWARYLASDIIESYSAGVKPTVVNPYAIKAMKERGVDISQQRSKHVSELDGIMFDYVITVCDNAKAQCPIFNAACKKMHVSFDDPPFIAAELSKQFKSYQEQFNVYLRVCDEIKIFIQYFALFLRAQI